MDNRHCNSGNSNSGNYNSGNYNSGHHNSGISNSGHYNSGNRNSGDHNSGNYNNGSFNESAPDTMRLFDVEVSGEDYTSFMKLIPGLATHIWTPSENMSEEEKKQRPEYETTGGYLKEIPYKEAWKVAWNKLEHGVKLEILEHKCFNAVQFDRMTGLNTTALILEKAIGNNNGQS